MALGQAAFTAEHAFAGRFRHGERPRSDERPGIPEDRANLPANAAAAAQGEEIQGRKDRKSQTRPEKVEKMKVQIPDVEDMVAAGLPLWAAFELWGEMITLSGPGRAPPSFEKMVSDRVARLRFVRQLQ